MELSKQINKGMLKFAWAGAVGFIAGAIILFFIRLIGGVWIGGLIFPVQSLLFTIMCGVGGFTLGLCLKDKGKYSLSLFAGVVVLGILLISLARGWCIPLAWGFLTFLGLMGCTAGFAAGWMLSFSKNMKNRKLMIMLFLCILGFITGLSLVDSLIKISKEDAIEIASETPEVKEFLKSYPTADVMAYHPWCGIYVDAEGIIEDEDRYVLSSPLCDPPYITDDWYVIYYDLHNEPTPSVRVGIDPYGKIIAVYDDTIGNKSIKIKSK
ncbi:MAG: hypothetical protein A7316_02870 [Candidatus Altiarchaeales archaeon WOR_SM1_86-2]|nr:MAG: hypothetical protein A7316_02870 [Candidatus Altiarchaeales archaeon WOR_SM1_86-2]